MGNSRWGREWSGAMCGWASYGDVVARMEVCLAGAGHGCHSFILGLYNLQFSSWL